MVTVCGRPSEGLSNPLIRPSIGPPVPLGTCRAERVSPSCLPVLQSQRREGCRRGERKLCLAGPRPGPSGPCGVSLGGWSSRREEGRPHGLKAGGVWVPPPSVPASTLPGLLRPRQPRHACVGGWCYVRARWPRARAPSWSGTWTGLRGLGGLPWGCAFLLAHTAPSSQGEPWGPQPRANGQARPQEVVELTCLFGWWL